MESNNTKKEFKKRNYAHGLMVILIVVMIVILALSAIQQASIHKSIITNNTKKLGIDLFRVRPYGWRSFVEDERANSAHYLNKLTIHMISLSMIVVAFTLVENLKVRTKLYLLFEHRLNFLPDTLMGIERAEVTLVSLFICYAAFFDLLNIMIKPSKNLAPPLVILTVLFFAVVVLFFTVVPLIVWVALKLLKKFKIGPIALVCATILIISTTCFFIPYKADTSRYEKMNMSTFSPEVTQYLKEQKLFDRVYTRNTGGKNTISIEGRPPALLLTNYDLKSDHRYLEGFFMKAAAYVENKTYLKESLSRILTQLVSYSIVFFLWGYVSNLYEDENVSKESFFLILVTVFLTSLFIYNNSIMGVTFRWCEYTTDRIVKEKGFAKDLLVYMLSGNKYVNVPFDYSKAISIFFLMPASYLSRVKNLLK